MSHAWRRERSGDGKLGRGPLDAPRSDWAVRVSTLLGYWGLTRARAREGHHSTMRQLAEMSVLFALRGHGPGYYHTAGFWRRTIPWQDKLDHLSPRAYTQRVAELNPLGYRKVSQHKLPEKALLSLCGVPTPRFYGFLHSQFGRDRHGQPLRDVTQLRELLERLQVERSFQRFCVKPIESWEGRGFQALDIHPSGLAAGVRRIGTDEWSSLETWCADYLDLNDPDGFLIEQHLQQHPWYAAYNPTSVNTFRVWVVRDASGAITPRLAMLKFGRLGSLVDNTTQGGIAAPVDLSTGVLKPAVDALPTRRAFETHPDSGLRIEGAQPPLFDSVLATAARALAVFPHLNFAGVDVAVTSEGAAIIELNVLPSRMAAALVDIPTARALA